MKREIKWSEFTVNSCLHPVAGILGDFGTYLFHMWNAALVKSLYQTILNHCKGSGPMKTDN